MNEEDVKPFLELVELLLNQRSHSSDNHKQNDYDNIILYLLEGKDITDPYERRLAGIEDKEWERKKNIFLKSIS